LVGGAGESAGHGHDHGDVDHGFVVAGQGFVVADAAAVFGDPSERSLDDPAAGKDQKPADLSVCLTTSKVNDRTLRAQMISRQA
jgi:hypothetical protein